jgi:hypothetical protein
MFDSRSETKLLIEKSLQEEDISKKIKKWLEIFREIDGGSDDVVKIHPVHTALYDWQVMGSGSAKNVLINGLNSCPDEATEIQLYSQLKLRQELKSNTPNQDVTTVTVYRGYRGDLRDIKCEPYDAFTLDRKIASEVYSTRYFLKAEIPILNVFTYSGAHPAIARRNYDRALITNINDGAGANSVILYQKVGAEILEVTGQDLEVFRQNNPHLFDPKLPAPPLPSTTDGDYKIRVVIKRGILTESEAIDRARKLNGYYTGGYGTNWVVLQDKPTTLFNNYIRIK